jgi:uncharacterized protein (DUF1778 family)
MTREREREMESTVAVTVMFRQSTLDKISEAACSLGLDVASYIGVAATSAARDALARADRFRMAGVRKEA